MAAWGECGDAVVVPVELKGLVPVPLAQPNEGVRFPADDARVLGVIDAPQRLHGAGLEAAVLDGALGCHAVAGASGALEARPQQRQLLSETGNLAAKARLLRLRAILRLRDLVDLLNLDLHISGNHLEPARKLVHAHSDQRLVLDLQAHPTHWRSLADQLPVVHAISLDVQLLYNCADWKARSQLLGLQPLSLTCKDTAFVSATDDLPALPFLEDRSC
mmetsp:Transcript_115949/g.247800  ORF Transcript_115949/g.247800 Transcript_115949/m.247800 type:complete len:218 (-) Transcript_115949:288-941(-)